MEKQKTVDAVTVGCLWLCFAVATIISLAVTLAIAWRVFDFISGF